MSEMKCPCCGGAMGFTADNGWSICIRCPFRCLPSCFHRIAAAMELAKARVAAVNYRLMDAKQIELWKEFSHMEQHVLEIFNEQSN